MSEERDAAPLLAARSLRTSAWELVREDIAHLRTGLDERPVGQRIKDKAADELVDAVDLARDIAAENKAVIAGTGLALAGWLLRGPIVTGIKAAIARLKAWKD